MLRAWDSLLAEIRASLPQRNKTQRVFWNCIMNDVFPRDRKVVVAAVSCLKLQRFTVRSSEDLFTFNLMLAELLEQFPSSLPKTMLHLRNILTLDRLCPSSIETHERFTSLCANLSPLSLA